MGISATIDTIDPHAEAYIKAVRKSAELLWLVIIGLCCALTLTLLLTIGPGLKGATVSKKILNNLIFFLIFPCPVMAMVAGPFYFRLRRIRKDSRLKRLAVVTGPYRTNTAQGFGGNSLNREQSIVIHGQTLFLPSEAFLKLPQTGTATCEYFPYTGICFRMDGRQLRGDLAAQPFNAETQAFLRAKLEQSRRNLFIAAGVAVVLLLFGLWHSWGVLQLSSDPIHQTDYRIGAAFDLLVFMLFAAGVFFPFYSKYRVLKKVEVEVPVIHLSPDSHTQHVLDTTPKFLRNPDTEAPERSYFVFRTILLFVIGVAFILFPLIMSCASKRMDSGAGEWFENIGVLFFFFGFSNLWKVWGGFSFDSPPKTNATGDAAQWLSDYGWNTEGTADKNKDESRFNLGCGWLVMAYALWLGLRALYHAFQPATRAMAPAYCYIAAFFVLLALLYLVNGYYYAARNRKYGTSYLRFTQFPFFLGNELKVNWRTEKPIEQPKVLSITLRCIEERQRVDRRGTVSIECWQIYADTLEIREPSLQVGGGKEYCLKMPLPADNRFTTCLKYITRASFSASVTVQVAGNVSLLNPQPVPRY